MPRRSELQGGEWLQWLGMTDWRLSQLHASCPRPYPPWAALPLPLQPSFDRKQEASRLVRVSSGSCPGSAALCPMTPSVLCWQVMSKKNNVFSGRLFLIRSWNRSPLLQRVCHHFGAQRHSYHRDVIWPPLVSAQHSSTSQPSCLSAAQRRHLGRFYPSDQQRGHWNDQSSKNANYFQEEGKGIIIKGLPQEVCDSDSQKASAVAFLKPVTDQIISFKLSSLPLCFFLLPSAQMP